MAVLILAATIGPKALYLMFAWLIGAALGSYISERKGYGQKAGLASGLLLSLPGGLAWFFVPARQNSDWKIKGPWGNERKDAKPSAQP